MRWIAILLAACALCGCGESSERVIEGLTGKQAVESGELAKRRIEQISAEHEKQLEQVLE